MTTDARRKTKELMDWGRMTSTHKAYFQALCGTYPVVAYGSAGTGKTYLPSLMAGEHMMTMRKNARVKLVRPIRSCGPSSGFLPGTMEEKLLPWMTPILENMLPYAPMAREIALNPKDERIEMVGLEFVRGRSWNNSFIIVDECQNATYDELAAVATRVGEHSMIVFTGDTRQADFENSGFDRFITAVMGDMYDCLATIRFTPEDNLRSGISRRFVECLYP